LECFSIIEPSINEGGNTNSPFYSCVLGGLAFEWKQGWS